MLIEIKTEQEFNELVLKSEGKVLVDFFASWCGPCKMQAPVLEKLAEENEDKKIFKVDIDEVRELAERFEIFSIPTLVFFENGKEVDRLMGLTSKSELLNKWGN